MPDKSLHTNFPCKCLPSLYSHLPVKIYVWKNSDVIRQSIAHGLSCRRQEYQLSCLQSRKGSTQFYRQNERVQQVLPACWCETLVRTRLHNRAETRLKHCRGARAALKVKIVCMACECCLKMNSSSLNPCYYIETFFFFDFHSGYVWFYDKQSYEIQCQFSCCCSKTVSNNRGGKKKKRCLCSGYVAHLSSHAVYIISTPKFPHNKFLHNLKRISPLAFIPYFTHCGEGMGESPWAAHKS